MVFAASVAASWLSSSRNPPNLLYYAVYAWDCTIGLRLLGGPSSRLLEVRAVTTSTAYRHRVD